MRRRFLACLILAGSGIASMVFGLLDDWVSGALIVLGALVLVLRRRFLFRARKDAVEMEGEFPDD